MKVKVKYLPIVRERTSIKNTVEQIQSMNHAIEKLADVTVDAIYEDDNNGYEMAKGILNTFADCETEKDQPETLSLCCHGIPGNPCMFHESLIPELLQLTGDQGGRKVLKQHICRYVEIEDEKELMDIDVPVY